MLRHVGIGAGEADAPVGLLGHRRPHLLAVDDPAAVDRARRVVVQRREVGARARLAEQLAPRDLAAQRRRGSSAAAARRCRRPRSVGSAHAADAQCGPPDLRGAELVVDDELLDRRPRRGPTAAATAARGSRRRPAGSRRSRRRGRRARRRTPATSARIRLAPRAAGRRRADGASPPSARVGGARPATARRRRAAGASAHRAPEVQVRVVLPGEPDAAEHLDAVLRASRRTASSASAAAAAAASGGVVRRRRAARAASHAAARASSVRASMSAHCASRPGTGRSGGRTAPAPCAYSDAVSTHHCATPTLSAANTVAARSRTRSASTPSSRRARYHGVVDCALRRRAGWGRGSAVRGGRELASVNDAPVVAGVGDEHARQVGHGTARSVPRTAVRRPPARHPPTVERDGPDGLTGRQPGDDVGGGLLAGRLDHGRGQHRGEERARRARPPQLLEHDCQLGQAVAPPPSASSTWSPTTRASPGHPRTAAAGGLGVQRRAGRRRRVPSTQPGAAEKDASCSFVIPISACTVSSGRPGTLGLLRILGAVTRASGFALVGSGRCLSFDVRARTAFRRPETVRRRSISGGASRRAPATSSPRASRSRCSHRRPATTSTSGRCRSRSPARAPPTSGCNGITGTRASAP